MKILGNLKSGETVVDRYISHLSASVSEHIEEGLLKISSKGQKFIEVTVNLGRVIGRVGVVNFERGDEIYYAVRGNRRGYSKFVKGKIGKETTFATFVLLKDEYTTNQYVLVTCYLGERVGPEPYDKRFTKRDRLFWKSHAFADRFHDVDKSTITTDAPNYWKI